MTHCAATARVWSQSAPCFNHRRLGPPPRCLFQSVPLLTAGTNLIVQGRRSQAGVMPSCSALLTITGSRRRPTTRSIPDYPRPKTKTKVNRAGLPLTTTPPLPRSTGSAGARIVQG